MVGLLEVLVVSVTLTVIAARVVQVAPFRKRAGRRQQRLKMLRVDSWKCAASDGDAEHDDGLGAQEEWLEVGAHGGSGEYRPCCEAFQNINDAVRVRMVKRTATGQLDVLLRPFCVTVVNFCLVFDALGATFAQLVKNEMLLNVAKIQAACAEHRTSSLREMVETEIRLGVSRYRDAGTEALLWLKRTLHFALLLIDGILEHEGDDFSLARCAVPAYDGSIRAAHNVFVGAVFRAALLALPDRETFFARLGPSEPLVRQDMREFVSQFGTKFAPIVDYYLDAKLEQVVLSRLQLGSVSRVSS